MPIAFPTQIVAYLERTLRQRTLRRGGTPQDFAGMALSFLELYNNLPPELIRLSSEDYSELLVAIGTVRFCVNQFQVTRDNDALHVLGLPSPKHKS